ncbi:MAG: N-acetylglutaminylglutamine synthetase [Nitriliruptoraceae bacterium]
MSSPDANGSPHADEPTSGKPALQENLSTRSWDVRPSHLTQDLVEDVALECGWGRLIFGQTFATHDDLVAAVSREEPGRRDICVYVREPHVLVSRAPQELFIDPSHTYRLWLPQRSGRGPVRGVVVRDMGGDDDAEAINRLYSAAGMLNAPVDVLRENQRTETFIYLVAEDEDTGEVIGTVTGVDHRQAFNDPEDGSSLWCLAVDPLNTRPGVGSVLVESLADRLHERGRAYLDLSVVHDNTPAITLYEKLGFERVPVYCVKRKNPINERLFAAAPAEGIDDLNPYARIIADEALRRGVDVRVVDGEAGLLRLSHGGRTIATRESLSELTTGVAVARCDDKRLTRRLLADAGLQVAPGRVATGDVADREFLADVGELVVKPARGEQGRGITVGVTTPSELEDAVELARRYCVDVILESCVRGQDLRIIVIDHEVVAAAVRRPATVVGTGRHTIGELIRSTARRREAVTGGESTIPLDDTTARAVADAGYALDDVLDANVSLAVRRTANVHTGGTIHDVTEQLHPDLVDVAVKASRVLDIPVVGLDLLVPAVDEPEYVIIEANERPGLANHEPQPTAERFIDLLFPSTRALPRGWQPGAVAADHQADDRSDD